MDNKFDLNIDNYSYTDLLELFHLDDDFNEDDLKQCYTMVIQMHPDKSGLDSSYFLFFSKAFKMIKNVFVYLQKQKNTRNIKSCPWKLNYTSQQHTILNDLEKENPNNDLKKIIASMDTKTFNETFNTIFDKVKKENHYEEHGYGEWFHSDKDYLLNTDVSIHSIQDMNDFIEKSKYRIKDNQIVKSNEYSTINNQHTALYSIVSNTQKYYGSDPFSKNKYEDLKQAYTESVIPVTKEDFLNRETYNNIQHLQNSRKKQETNSTHYYMDHNQIFKDREKEEQRKNLDLAYQLLKHEEKAKKANTMFVSNFRTLLDIQ